MIDIKLVRERPDIVRESLAKRHTTAPVDDILSLDEKRRTLLSETEVLRARRNVVSKQISRMKDDGERRALIDEMREVGTRIMALDAELHVVQSNLTTALLQVPNMPHPDTPVGADEGENVIVRSEGTPREFDFEPLAHWDLGPALGIIDFERGVKLSGTRFYVLKGLGARLQRALIAWMLELHTNEHGYTEAYLPFVVKEACMWGSGQLPKFRDNLYRDVEDDLWLVPTAEVPLTNLHRDEILAADDLPIKYAAYTPCFRREKMSAGKDTRGIKRGHQFDKVEMYKFTRPEDSDDELYTMLDNAEEVCRLLGIPHRVMQLCTGDLGFSAALSFDVELWSPGCGEWLEVSSCSNCTDFQARRANVRYRPKPGEKPEFVHTLNGSGLALPRVMIAVMENYQQKDGSILIPEVLRPYMGGIEVIH
ncbi:MAG: serine--tRNA ligase [Anaerolineae bacterium]|nr:serine--tRNA ligase [Anaerolineae bacterium]